MKPDSHKSKREHKRFSLYCTTNDRFPIRLVDVSELFWQELAKRGVEQHWFSPGRQTPGLMRRETVDNDVKVTVSPATGKFGKVGTAFNIIAEWVTDTVCLSLLVFRPPDVIQVRDKYWAAVVAWPIARLTGSLFTIWVSFPYPEADIDRADRKGSRLKRKYLKTSGRLGEILLYEFAMKRADHCFVQTEEMKKSLIARGIEAKKMTPVPMGITPRVLDHQKQAETAGVEDLSDQFVKPACQHIFYLGTLDRDRELTVMIDSFARVLQTRPDTILILAGGEANPGDQQALVSRAQALGVLDNVVFTGMLPMEQAWQILDRVDVCWCPIVNNRVLRVGSPTKLIEYMAFEKPIVANEHPEHQLVLEQSGAGYCVPYTAEGFAKATCELLENPVAAQAMGQRGLPWVIANRSYDKIASQVLAQYESLLGLDEPEQAEANQAV